MAVMTCPAIVRCLLVDDLPIHRKGLKKVLEQKFQNIECETAETADSAIEKAKARPFDLIILDYYVSHDLSDKNGADIAKAILDLHSNAYVIGFTTSNNEPEVISACLKAGMKAVLPKDWMIVRKYVAEHFFMESLCERMKDTKIGQVG
jgi:DNA-binding NarL/FixJ family response regulator